ncbi:MAG: glycosyltransferase family 4 protein [Infirmifilum sp.]
MKRALLISMPFKVGIGGFIRSYNVFPRLAKSLAESYEVELFIPVNAIRTVMKIYLLEILSRDDNIKLLDHVNAVNDKIQDDIRDLERLSNYSFMINEKVLERALKVNSELLLKEHRENEKYFRVMSIRAGLLNALHPLLMRFFENKYIIKVKELYQGSYDFIYSQHETIDALEVLRMLSKQSKRVIILLQSNIGRNRVERVMSEKIMSDISRRTHISGFLSVSPQPIVETPFLLKFVKPENIRILYSAVAIDPKLLDYAREIKHLNSAVFFGRLTVEKGIIDLLKAWKHVIAIEPQAILTLIGLPESNYVDKILRDAVAQMRDNIRYIGYIPHGEKLFQIVSRHKVLAYPSRRDSFSLTVLESLAMGLRVVAYDIPALRYIYQGSRLVKLLPPGDYKQLALKIIESFKEDTREDSITSRILSAHSSWEKVALGEYRCLLELVTK